MIDIDKRLAPKLEAEGVTSYPRVAGLDEAQLAKIKSQKGDNIAGARRILENVAALERDEPVRRLDDAGKPVVVDPAVTDGSAFVMFDLEGVPPDLDEAEKVYLWGMQVFEQGNPGESSGDFVVALAGFGDGGERSGLARLPQDGNM